MQKYNPKNADIQVYIGGELFHRDQAKVSVFDSTVQGGDAVWEGLRVYDGRIFSLDHHIDRMIASAKAMAFSEIPSRDYIKQAIFKTLEANGMRDETHIRMTLSRGLKTTSGMDPLLNQFGSTLIVLAEWKPPIYDKSGIRLITSSIRRNSPSCIDSKIHHNNLINNILAKVEANVAGVDDALMLDLNGFVAETNATNVFMVRKGEVHTPLPHACLPGITRGLIMEICKENEIPLFERNVSVAEFHAADEVFTTGTMGELSPVLELDGRIIGDGEIGTMTLKLKELFHKRTLVEGEPLPF
ncbi:MAG: aminotransferase class IV [Bacteroidia bacterium]|nr:aminotransferase class IV [Bacteroidia bacterium]